MLIYAADSVRPLDGAEPIGKRSADRHARDQPARDDAVPAGSPHDADCRLAQRIAMSRDSPI
jgi:hypothetical protein